MPELPEVETVRRSLVGRVEQRSIVTVTVRDSYVLRQQPVEEFVEGLVGQQFRTLNRHGKLLFFPFGDRTLCVHLGMTGQLTIRLDDRPDTPFIVTEKTGLQQALQHPPDKHTHISITLDDGAVLHYRDVRKFGRFFWIPERTPEEVVRRFNLGVDPLTESFTTNYLREGLKNRKAPVKAVLLDQRFLAGLGNIYVDEALFEAGIRPGRAAGRVGAGMADALFEAIVKVLNKGIEAGGTTLRDFVDGDGQGGYNQEELLVYGRYGKSCPSCQAVLKRGRYGGRTTTYCSFCQR